MNQIEHPLTSEVNGELCVSPVGLFLMVARKVYGPQDDPNNVPGWTGRPAAEALIRDILSEARAGGYTRGDILHTLLAKDERSWRVEAMAREACNAVEGPRFVELVQEWAGKSK